MTRAFAAISAKGVAVEPYGITKVTTAGGELLYERERPRETSLVPDYVVAGMTDMLQTAVQTGTGRAAQIGRPVAGKTGTTSSNKDGWFVGFSSGITTGVWMGRDDAKAVPGLQGGRAPARAFAAYMRYAVKDRAVEQFDTELNLPEWQLEPDEEYLYGDPDDYYFIDEDGNLIEPGRRDPSENPFDIEGERSQDGRTAPPADEPPPAASEDFLERATGGELPGNSGGSAQAPPRTPQPPSPVRVIRPENTRSPNQTAPPGQ